MKNTHHLFTGRSGTHVLPYGVESAHLLFDQKQGRNATSTRSIQLHVWAFPTLSLGYFTISKHVHETNGGCVCDVFVTYAPPDALEGHTLREALRMFDEQAASFLEVEP